MLRGLSIFVNSPWLCVTLWHCSTCSFILVLPPALGRCACIYHQYFALDAKGISADFQSTLSLFKVPLHFFYRLDILSRQWAGAMVRLNSFVLLLSGITLLCCLLSKPEKSCFIHWLFCLLLKSGRWIWSLLHHHVWKKKSSHDWYILNKGLQRVLVFDPSIKQKW